MTDVSVIIPTFNRARFLRAAIDSALAQGEGVEVIVVDDGSTDQTGKLLDDYGDRIRVLRQANQGPSAARNLGARQARGDYLFFLDSDDLIEPGGLRALMTEADARGPKSIPFGSASIIDEAGQPAGGVTYGYPHLPAGHTLALADLLGAIMPLCLTVHRRTEFLHAGGLNPVLRLGEDQELAVRLHRSGLRFVATGLPIVRVRVHGSPRLTGSGNRELARRLLQLWQTIAELVVDAPDLDARSRQSLARVIWVAGRDAARAKDRDAAKTLFALARRFDTAAGRISPRPLRFAAKLVGPYRAERCVEFVKKVLRRF